VVLQGTEVADEGMKQVPRLQCLRKLYLDDTQMGNKGLRIGVDGDALFL
jgi:hypothetical protein